MVTAETPEKRVVRLERLKINSRAWYLKNRERHLANSKRYASENREHRLKVGYLWRKKNPDKVARRERKYREKHAEVCRKRSRDWYARNKEGVAKRKKGYFSRLSPARKELYRERMREFARNNKALFYFHSAKRRALKKQSTHNPKQIREWWQEVFKRQFVDCYYCQNPIHVSEAHREHVIPLKRGGPHSIMNLCTACPSCNLSKSVKLPSEWDKLPQMFLNL